MTVCAPVPQLPFSVSVSDWFAACRAFAVNTPPICVPSTLTVYCASPFQASSLMRRTSVSSPVPAVRLTGCWVEVEGGATAEDVAARPKSCAPALFIARASSGWLIPL